MPKVSPKLKKLSELGLRPSNEVYTDPIITEICVDSREIKDGIYLLQCLVQNFMALSL